MLTRRRALVEEQDSKYVADDEGDSGHARTLRPMQAAACTYRIAFGWRAGHELLRVQGASPREPGFAQDLCAEMQGSTFTLPCFVTAPTAKRWSDCAATPRVWRWPTTGCNATLSGGWCSS